MRLDVPPAPQRDQRQPPGGAATPRLPWRSRLTQLDIKYSPYLYIAPFFVLFGIFGLFPLGYTFWVSLHDWELIGDHELIGLGNYTSLLSDDRFWNSVGNTFGIFSLSTVPQLVTALILAALLNQAIRGRLFFRMGVLIPMVTSLVAVAIVFTQLYGRDYGMINWLLGMFGVDNINWQAQKWSSWIAIASMVNWRWTGYNTLIYLAAMQAIPRDYYEAASIDGASRVRQFWRITVPLLRPTIIFTAIISTIGGLQLFTEPLLFGSGLMTGGTLGQFQTMTMFMFQSAFRDFDYGYGSAVAWVLLLFIIAGSVLNFLIVRRLSTTR
jgi:cellobiose transport system permease protein